MEAQGGQVVYGHNLVNWRTLLRASETLTPPPGDTWLAASENGRPENHNFKYEAKPDKAAQSVPNPIASYAVLWHPWSEPNRTDKPQQEQGPLVVGPTGLEPVTSSVSGKSHSVS